MRALLKGPLLSSFLILYSFSRNSRVWDLDSEVISFVTALDPTALMRTNLLESFPLKARTNHEGAKQDILDVTSSKIIKHMFRFKMFLPRNVTFI